MTGFSIDISSNIKQVQRELTRIQRKQIPFATAKALTDVAKDAQKAVTAQIDTKLDRPTPFTRRAIGFKKADKIGLFSEVFVKPIQSKYLQWQIFGGERKQQSNIGVPTRNKKLNKYGNIPGRRKGLVKGKKQFTATINGISGVWERYGGKRNPRVKLVVAFEQSVTYRKRLPFKKIVTGVVANRFHKRFNSALALALSTAR